MGRRAAGLAAQDLQICLLQVAPDISVELAGDLELVRREIDALETGCRAQAAIAVIDVVGLARQPDRRPPAMASRDQLPIRPPASAARTGGCRRRGNIRARYRCRCGTGRRMSGSIRRLPSPSPRRPGAARSRRRRNAERLAAVEAEAGGGVAVVELQRQHPHADQVGAVDALEALGDHRAHAEQQRPLAAQSRELPVPYSLPAMTTSGVPSASSASPRRRSAAFLRSVHIW